MKYIYKNIKKFICNDSFMFALVILTVLVSCIMLHFSYGLYQSYMSEKEADASNQYSASLTFSYNFEEYNVDKYGDGQCEVKAPEGVTEFATVEMLKNFAKDLSNTFQEDLLTVETNAVVETYRLYSVFDILNGEIILSELYEENLKKGSKVSSGRFFSPEEFKEGEKVAIAFDKYNINVGNTPYMDKMLVEEDRYVLLGENKYKVIGWGSIDCDLPTIPITALPDNTPLEGYITFTFEHPVNRGNYQELKELAESDFQGLAQLESMALPNVDQIYLYNTIIIISVLIALVSSMNFAILYRYILTTRKKELRIFRICGMTRLRAVVTYITECLFITLPVYFCGVFLFAKGLLPIAKQYFYYMYQSYSKEIYGTLFAIYYGVSFLILITMILISLKKDEQMQVGGGYR